MAQLVLCNCERLCQHNCAKLTEAHQRHVSFVSLEIVTISRRTSGSVIVVLASILAQVFLAYTRTALAKVLRDASTQDSKEVKDAEKRCKEMCSLKQGESRLFWCGVFTQAGSFVGAVVIFPMVNVWNVFSIAPACPTQ